MLKRPSPRGLGRRLLGAVAVLAVLGAFWTIAGPSTTETALIERSSRASQAERPHGAQDTVQLRSGAVGSSPRLTSRTDLHRVASRLLALWAAASLVLVAVATAARRAPLDLLRTSATLRPGLRLRGPPA